MAPTQIWSLFRNMGECPFHETRGLNGMFLEGDADSCFSFSPFPYHPFGSAKPYGTVADEEGARLEILFKEVVSRKTGA